MTCHLLLLNCCCLYYSLSYIDRKNHIVQESVLKINVISCLGSQAHLLRKKSWPLRGRVFCINTNIQTTNIYDNGKEKKKQKKDHEFQSILLHDQFHALFFFSSDTGQQSHHETSDLTVASRYSPRSTLEAHSSLSPPHTGCNRHYPSPSASTPSNVKHGAKKSSNFR